MSKKDDKNPLKNQQGYQRQQQPCFKISKDIERSGASGMS